MVAIRKPVRTVNTVERRQVDRPALAGSRWQQDEARSIDGQRNSPSAVRRERFARAIAEPDRRRAVDVPDVHTLMAAAALPRLVEQDRSPVAGNVAKPRPVEPRQIALGRAAR